MFEPLDKEVVAQYSEAFKRGDAFPAVVIARTNQRQRGVLVDGNHRLNGMIEAGGEDIDGYVITKARPATIVQMTFEANDAVSTLVHTAQSSAGRFPARGARRSEQNDRFVPRICSQGG